MNVWHLLVEFALMLCILVCILTLQPEPGPELVITRMW